MSRVIPVEYVDVGDRWSKMPVKVERLRWISVSFIIIVSMPLLITYGFNSDFTPLAKFLVMLFLVGGVVILIMGFGGC